MLYVALFAKNNKNVELYGKYIDSFVYTKLSPHKNFWKLIINEIQYIELKKIIENYDMFLNIDNLLLLDSYFEYTPDDNFYDLSERGLTIFEDEYITLKDKIEVNDE